MNRSDVVLTPPASSFPRAQVRTLYAGGYSLYPHSNAHHANGQRVVLGEQLPHGESRLISVSYADGTHYEIARFPVSSLWSDIALTKDILAVNVGQSLWVGEPGPQAKLRKIYDAPQGYTLNGLCSIHPDGTHAVLTLRHGEGGAGVVVDLATGNSKIAIEHEWWADHFVFSPADPQWISYGWQSWTTPRYKSHGNLMWAYHPLQAPQGRQIFDQVTGAADPSKPMHTTHDRWAYDSLSIFTIVYHESPGGPKGLWQVFPDGKPLRLISAGEGDWHCDVTRDGKWAVIDTVGPHEVPGQGWTDGKSGSDIMLVEIATGKRMFLTRVPWLNHPYHPHPTFSPDGTKILVNSAQQVGDRIESAVQLISLEYR